MQWFSFFLSSITFNWFLLCYFLCPSNWSQSKTFTLWYECFFVILETLASLLKNIFHFSFHQETSDLAALWFGNCFNLGICLVMFMLFINYVMLHNTNPVTGWKCDKRGSWVETQSFTTTGPMQITNHFGGARSLCGAHFLRFLFHLFNKKFYINFFIVKNQHFLFLFKYFFSLIIWRHFRSDESGPVFLHFIEKI